MADTSIARPLALPRQSFFLFGARGTGKSRWLREQLADAAIYLDLLDETLRLELLSDPSALARRLDRLGPGDWVVIDEVQRAPVLLNTVHRYIENKRLRFALCGSSARSLRRRGVNLLAGRAVERRLHPFTPVELGGRFDLDEALRIGTLPLVWSAAEPRDTLESYVQTYLTQEIQAEAAVRGLPSFVRFLPLAALFHAQLLNVAALSRDAGVPRTTVQTYLEILHQTLLTYQLPAYRPRLRVKEVAHPKLYWADAGLVRAFKRSLGALQAEERGALFEGWVAQTLRAMNDYVGLFDEWFYWSSHGTGGSIEVDFLLRRGKQFVAIEAKAAKRVKPEMLKGLHGIADLNGTKRRILVYGGSESWRTSDGIEILTSDDFAAQLARGL